mmetsp:Transcript_37616/g.118599  ORF Transcript_37616/g.118599 Transcript_37616/m.118599 type:complete len:280 (+) Transcript_37616:382-1221(+)
MVRHAHGRPARLEDRVHLPVGLRHLVEGAAVAAPGGKARQLPEHVGLEPRGPRPDAVDKDQVHVRLVEGHPVVHEVPHLGLYELGELDEVVDGFVLGPAPVGVGPLGCRVVEEGEHHLHALAPHHREDLAVPLERGAIDAALELPAHGLLEHDAPPVDPEAEDLHLRPGSQLDLALRLSPEAQALSRAGVVLVRRHAPALGKVEPRIVQIVLHVTRGGGEAEEELLGLPVRVVGVRDDDVQVRDGDSVVLRVDVLVYRGGEVGYDDHHRGHRDSPKRVD